VNWLNAFNEMVFLAFQTPSELITDLDDTHIQINLQLMFYNLKMTFTLPSLLYFAPHRPS
jgi:hypothetical protein